MTDFRATEDIQADLRRFDPGFTQFTSASQLLNIGQILDGSTSGPTIFNLGVINEQDPNSEWQGVVRFLNSRLVTPQVRRELQQLQRDLQAADTDHDGIVNNQELVAYAQAHTDRWPNVVTFRSAADLLLNRLPGYLAQPNLNQDQISHLWGVMNQLAREWDQAGANETNRGLVYGLSLVGFPSTDQNNPPDLIRRALRGELNPDELAAVHQILTVQSTPQGYNFQNGSAPMNPLEIGGLSLVLDRASQAHHSLYGMTLVSGDEEQRLYAERNRSLNDCHAAVQRAADSTKSADVDRAYADCAASLNRVETDQNAHPDQIGIHEILLRAQAGALTPAETAALRTWMQQEMSTLGMTGQTCSGAFDCFGQGALMATRQLITNPHNWAFIGGGMLYRRLVLQNLFASRMTQICGGAVANPRQAYKDFERYLDQSMKQSPGWKRFLNQVIRNPRRASFWGRAGINFPINALHLIAFNRLVAEPMNGLWDRLADPRVHPHLNDALQYLTDFAGIALFNAWEAADAMNTSKMQQFAGANPGVCRQEPQTAPVTAPAPENVQSSVTAAHYNGTVYADLLMAYPELNALQPRQFLSDFPWALQAAFTTDTQSASIAWNLQGTGLENALISRYGRSDAEKDQIRSEIRPFMDVYRTQGMTPGFLMALRLYTLSHELGRIADARRAGGTVTDGDRQLEAAAQAIAPGMDVTLAALRAQPDYLSQLTGLAQAGKFPRQMSQADFGLYLDRVPGASAGAPTFALHLPPEFQFLGSPYAYYYAEADAQAFQSIDAQHLADVLVQSYGQDSATAARIRADVPLLLSPYGHPDLPATLMTQINGAKWALQWYIAQLQSGRLPSRSAVQTTVAQAQASGIVGAYFDIRESILSFAVNYQEISFTDAAERHWHGVDYAMTQRTVEAEAARRGWSRAYVQNFPDGEGFSVGEGMELYYHHNPVYKDGDGDYHTFDLSQVPSVDQSGSSVGLPVLPLVVSPAIVPISISLPSFSFSGPMEPAFI